MVHTVAVDRHVVHHRDIDHAVLPFEVVVNGLGSGGHRLEEPILVANKLARPQFALVEFVHLACRVDVSLAIPAGAPYGEVLQRPSVATHGMALEMVKGNEEIVVGEVSAHDVVVEMGMVAHGDAYFVVFVHDVDGEIPGESVPVDDAPMVLRVVAHVVGVAPVGRVTLHDGAIDLIDQVFHQFWFEVVGVRTLARRHLDGHAPTGLYPQRLIDFQQCFGSDLAREVDLRLG